MDGRDRLNPADWVHLPPAAEPLSLWASLHDAYVEAVRIDRPARRLTLDLRIPHLGAREGTPGVPDFRLQMERLSALRASFFLRVDVPAPEPASGSNAALPRQGDTAPTAIEESLGWDQLTEAIAEESFEILEAALMRGEGHLTLRLDGRLEDQWGTLVFRAEELRIYAATGEPLTLEAFLGVGEAYWERFAQRRRARE